MIPPYVIMGMYDYISMPGNVLIIIRNAAECKQSLREITGAREIFSAGYSVKRQVGRYIGQIWIKENDRMRINYNVSASIANKNLLGIESNLSQSMERLSSGLKINHAKDNPGGNGDFPQDESTD